jgi:hypothetical protein
MIQTALMVALWWDNQHTFYRIEQPTDHTNIMIITKYNYKTEEKSVTRTSIMPSHIRTDTFEAEEAVIDVFECLFGTYIPRPPFVVLANQLSRLVFLNGTKNTPCFRRIVYTENGWKNDESVYGLPHVFKRIREEDVGGVAEYNLTYLD